jgi:hypothetical protein
VRGSGARYEGPRQVESLEAFYQEKLVEDANVCLMHILYLINYYLFYLV